MKRRSPYTKSCIRIRVQKIISPPVPAPTYSFGYVKYKKNFFHKIYLFFKNKNSIFVIESFENFSHSHLGNEHTSQSKAVGNSRHPREEENNGYEGLRL